jgi:hypothetical protein
MDSDDKKQTVGKSTLMVRSQFKSGDDEGPVEEKDELLAVHKFLAPPAKVSCGMGLTINMGNYESARIDVVVEVPCYREEVEEAYTYARKFCESRIKDEAGSIKNKSPF